MYTKEKLDYLMRQIEADEPRIQEIKREQLEYFQRICPDRCGKIDLEKIEVVYDDEKYTADQGNHGIESIEDWIRCCDLVGLDYEIRIAELYDPSKAFNIKFPDTEDENRKYCIASELQGLYTHYYRELLIQNGIDIPGMKGFRYLLPWTGCEREIMPDKYSESLLLTEKEVMDVLERLYPEAYKKATAPKAIADFNFEKIMADKGSKKLCRARLDEAHLQMCRKDGFQMLSVDIPAEKFMNPVSEEIQDGRKVYCFEFMI